MRTTKITQKGELMNIMGYISKIQKFGKLLTLVLLVLSLSFAQSSGVLSGMAELCRTSQLFLGVTSMLLIVLAGTAYAIGQMMGAETRARAAVWATAMLTGAVIGIIIYLVSPAVIKAFVGNGAVGSHVAESGADPCTFTN